MAFSLTTDAILFSINSAIKLGRNLQRAYALSLRTKELVLPLPAYNRDVSETTVEFFFEDEGKSFLGKIDRLDELHEKAKNSRLDDEELEEYRQFYGVFFAALNPQPDPSQEATVLLDTQEVLYLFTIRQWERGKAKRRTALQLVAGTIVEIGVDYFQSVPGALNLESSQGRIVHSFLTAIDDISFSEETDLKALLSRRIVPGLFISAVETLEELSTEIAQDEKIQRFIQTTSKHIADDLFQRLENTAAGHNPDEVVNWGRVVFSSLIRNASQYVFTSADHLFDTNEAESKLIESTGLTLMSMLFDESGDSINLRKVLTADGLDTIVRSALAVIGEHPELLSRQEGIRQIVGGISNALSQSGLQRPDLLPELARLILENTAGNLHLLWRAEQGEAEHLLLTTVSELLALLARPVPEGQWRPQLSRSQLLGLATLLVDEVVNNPDWALRSTDEQSILGGVLRSTFDALRNVPPQERLTLDTLEWIIQLNLRAVVTTPRILEAVDLATDEEEKVILEQAMTLAVSFVFAPDSRQTPKVYRAQLLKELLEYIFGVILARHPDQRGLMLVDLILFKESGLDFSKGFNREWADRLLDAALTVLARHPELIGDKAGLRDIVSGVAAALRQADLKDPDLLPELIRVVLENTAAQLPLIVETAPGKIDNLLILALQQTLAAISQKSDDTSRWRPQLTTPQVLEVAELILEEVVDNPLWVKEGSLVQHLLEGTFNALQEANRGNRPGFDLLRVLLTEALVASQQQMAFLKEIKLPSQNNQDMAINLSLHEFVLVIYDSDLDTEVRWTLTQTNVIEALLEVFLLRVQRGGASVEAIQEATEKLKSTIREYRDQVLTTVDQLLASFEEVES